MANFMPQLRQAIMPLHDEAEKNGPLREVVEKTVTLENYRKILLQLYGFVVKSEEVIGLLIKEQAEELEWKKRQRALFLQKDLFFLGESQQSIDQKLKKPDLSGVRTEAQALGLMYLFEGSRLGGLVLSKILRERFGFQNYQGYSYFSSNGLDVVTIWQKFQNFMERYVDSTGSGQEIMISAKQGFESLNKWLDKS